MLNTKELENANILIVDDNADNLDVLFTFLDKFSPNISMALSGEKAIDLAKKFQPDIILLDVMMPGIDGFETCHLLKQDEETKDIVVIFMTALADSIDKVKGFQAGGSDYITKPLQYEEVLARLNVHLTVRHQQKKLVEQNIQLRKMVEQMDQLARIDPLTKLSNRRDFWEKLECEKSHFMRSGRPFTLILADIDHFKQCNDEHGHNVGDFVLVSVAKRMRSILRKGDHIARWGGEEFIILLADTNLQQAEIVAEKIRKKISHNTYHCEGKDIQITITLGVSTYTAENLSTCIRNVDYALYKGKQKGRNCVVINIPKVSKN